MTTLDTPTSRRAFARTLLLGAGAAAGAALIRPDKAGASSGSGGLNMYDKPYRAFDSRSDYHFLQSGEVATIHPFGSTPVNVTAAYVNLTVTNTIGAGWLAQSLSPTVQPSTSDVNWYEAGAIVSNSTPVKVLSNNTFYLWVYGGAHVVVDVVGYFLP